MEALVKGIAAEYGILIAVLFSFLVIGAGLLFRYTNWFSKPSDKGLTNPLAPFEDRINDIDRRVERIDVTVEGLKKSDKATNEKIGKMERDISHLATKEELAELQLSVARSDERVKGMHNEIRKVGAAVYRIEDFMMAGSAKGKQ